MKNIFITSDYHLDHRNIIDYCKRPFENAKEMNEEIIRKNNEMVGEFDMVFNLGDFCMSRDWKRWAEHFNRLNGKHYLIKGNHDRDSIFENLDFWYAVKGKLGWVKDMFLLKTKGRGANLIVLCHYAMRTWPKAHWGSLHCYGHSHGGLPEDPKARSMDVGVDTNNFYPYSFEEIRDRLLQKDGYIVKR